MEIVENAKDAKSEIQKFDKNFPEKIVKQKNEFQQRSIERRRSDEPRRVE